jgi:hypothetical protein
MRFRVVFPHMRALAGKARIGSDRQASSLTPDSQSQLPRVSQQAGADAEMRFPRPQSGLT